RQVDALGGGDAGGDRGDVGAGGDGGGRRGGRLGGRGGLRGGSGRAGAERHAGDDLADADRVALVVEDLGDGAAGRGGQLHVDLVGGHLDADLVGFDRIALLLVPLQDGPFGHRLAHGGHGDLRRRIDCHRSPYPSARTRPRERRKNSYEPMNGPTAPS